jgi:hypothetical protein
MRSTHLRRASATLIPVLKNLKSTIRKDHKGHKDRGSLTEGNEGNEEGGRDLA